MTQEGVRAHLPTYKLEPDDDRIVALLPGCFQSAGLECCGRRGSEAILLPLREKGTMSFGGHPLYDCVPTGSSSGRKALIVVDTALCKRPEWEWKTVCISARPAYRADWRDEDEDDHIRRLLKCLIMENPDSPAPPFLFNDDPDVDRKPCYVTEVPLPWTGSPPITLVFDENPHLVAITLGRCTKKRRSGGKLGPRYVVIRLLPSFYSKKTPVLTESNVAPHSHDCRHDHIHYRDEYIALKDTSCWRTISRGPSKDREAVKVLKVYLTFDKASSDNSRGALELEIDRIDVDVSVCRCSYTADCES